jgi:thiamine kinase-like enzyme
MISNGRCQVERGELAAALEQVLTRHFGARRRLRWLRRRLSVYSSSCTIENLEVELDSGQKLRLIFKDLSPTTLLAGAQQVRPDFLYQPQREITTYEAVLRDRGLGTATCYGSVHAAATERHWLFLERVTGPMLWQVGRLEAWEQAGRWLARLHSEFANAGVSSKCTDYPYRHSTQEGDRIPPNGKRFAHLLQHDEAFFRIWVDRAEAFLRHRHTKTSVKTRRKFRHLADRYDRLVGRLMELPRTLVHGEFYPSNIIVGRTENGHRICPVDWELAGIAPSLIDLAALTAGNWAADEQERMIAAYRDALEPTNHWPPPLPELIEAVECCRLHWAVRWLGWASDWSPPEQHARNWLREALYLSEKLRL